MPVDGSSGDATMQSYLNALHEFAPQGTILIVRGTYFDKARHSPENGWQIYDMNLVYVFIETREHTPPAPPEEESTEEGGGRGTARASQPPPTRIRRARSSSSRAAVVKASAAKASAAELPGEVVEVGGVEVEAVVRLQVVAPGRAVLAGAGDEGGVESAG